MKRCRLICDPPAEGSWNMAVDELLLEAAAAGETTLRYYSWTRPTLSIGYFQASQDRSQHVASQSCPLVRRTSGGGAILHHHELTYSFATPAAPRRSRDQSRLYEGFHRSLVEILNRRGVNAELCPGSAAVSHPEPFLCFQRHTSGDVLVGQSKIAGSAQRRYRAALLQHGSVLLDRSPYAAELPGIRQLAHADLPAAELAAEWLDSLARQWSLDPVRSMLSVKERERVADLCTTKYSRPGWTDRR